METTDKKELTKAEYLISHGATRYIAEEYINDYWDDDISREENLDKFLAQMFCLGIEI